MARTVLVPLDVEAAIIGWLNAQGVPARTQVPIERSPGMVRVTRAGGPMDGYLDRPDLFVEVWGADQGDSFDLAVRLFGLMVLMVDAEDRPEIGLRSVTPTPPVTLQDDYAPELHRHVFNVSMVCAMGQMEV